MDKALINKVGADVIDGKAFAARLYQKITERVSLMANTHNVVPGLAVVLVGEDPASQVYVRNKARQTLAVGMNSFEFKMPADTSEEALLEKIKTLNDDPTVHGILVQLPLPQTIDEGKVLGLIKPEKDVDGFHPINVGKFVQGKKDGFIPCTPYGCLMLLKDFANPLQGKNAVVIGRSNIVGKPMAHLLLQENATVTIAHSRTKDLPSVCRQADILVAAVGRARFVKKDWVKKGAAVIDVGINRIEAEGGKTKLVGDVDFEEVVEQAGVITPVPGGVGPMTIAVLVYNSMLAACRQHNLPENDFIIEAIG